MVVMVTKWIYHWIEGIPYIQMYIFQLENYYLSYRKGNEIPVVGHFKYEWFSMGKGETYNGEEKKWKHKQN